MKYRKFGRFDWEVSVLGIGLAQLPLLGEDVININETEFINKIRYLIDRGANYLDLGYPDSMRRQKRLTCLISQALQDGYRQKIKMAITLPSYLINAPHDFDHFLNEQLQWLNLGIIDFCLLGGLNREIWPKLQGLGVLGWAESAMKHGRIGKLGFSFHDSFQFLRNILAAYDNWALCQFQYSYLDVDRHPGFSGIKYAAEKGLAVVISQPHREERLAQDLPEPVAKLWANASHQRSWREWGLRWVWNHPEVSVVVSDMFSMEQAVENAALVDKAEPDNLTVQELALTSQVRDAYRKLRPIQCTACSCCMPCPENIDVPRILELYNDAIIYNDYQTPQLKYNIEQLRADRCTQCGICVSACPRRVAILDWLKAAHLLLAGCG